MSPGQENTLDWEVVYALPETKELSAEALAAMAPYFEDVDKRRDWLLPLVNDNLTAEDAWELTPGGFSNLIAALFEVLRRGLADHDERPFLEARLGVFTCNNLDRILQMIEGATG